MAGANHCEHVACVIAAFAQFRGHVLVAFVDQGGVQRRRVLGELAEAGFQHVAFLQALDVFAGHVVVGEQTAGQAADQLHPVPPAQAVQDAAEGDAHIAVDQLQRQSARCGFDRCGFQFGAGFDVQLFGQPALIRGQCQVGGKRGDLAFANHLDQVELGQGVRLGQRLVPLLVEFHGHRVEAAAVDCRAHRIDARFRDVRSAQQGVAHAIALKLDMRLVGPVGGRHLGGGSRSGLNHDNASSDRHKHRSGGRAGTARSGARVRCVACRLRPAAGLDQGRLRR